MSNNAVRLTSVAQLRSRSEEKADARVARVGKQGAFAQQWAERTNPAMGLVFNPYIARAGEISACTRLTTALLREGEEVTQIPVRQVCRTKYGWDWTPVGFGRFIGPWLTETRVGGVCGPLHPIRVARESTHEQVKDVKNEKALVGWINSAADLAEEFKSRGDRLGMICLRKFFEAGVMGDGSGPNSPYCSHVEMHEVVGKMSPARLVRRMVEVRFAALRRMRPLAGVIKCPSWAAVAVATVQNLPIGKASIIAMAMTLASPRLADGGGALRYYRAARRWLQENLATSVDKVEELEGVATVTRPAVVIHGVRVSRAVELRPDGNGRVGAGGRGGSQFLGSIGDFVYHGGFKWRNPHEFARAVLAEYRKHQEAMASELRKNAASEVLAQAIETGKVVVLATWQDSYDAGNCHPGTLEFARRIGAADKKWVDVTLLLKSKNDRAVAAGHIALQRASEWIVKGDISFAA